MARPISKREAGKQTFDGFLIFVSFVGAIGYAFYLLADQIISAIF